MAEKNYITPQGLEKLKAEYRHLFHDERPKLVEVVAWAASNGDRSENADYQYGKKRLREIDRRLHFLKNRLEDAEVVDPATMTGSKILFGALVTVEKSDGTESSFHIVGEDEIDAARGAISWKSPIAKALLGKSEGDDVLVKKPSGDETWSVLSVKYLQNSSS